MSTSRRGGGRLAWLKLVDAFVTAMPEPLRPRWREVQDLEVQLSEFAESSSRLHAHSFALSPEAFIAHVGARVTKHLQPRQALTSQLAGPDLYLACGCVAGHEAAIHDFVSSYGSVVEHAWARAPEGGVTPVEDARAVFLERLLFAAEDRPPRLASYGGRGLLGTWLKVAATRAVLDLERKATRTAEHHAAWSDSLCAATTADVELTLFREQYTEAFRLAFVAAVHSLTARERNVLRLALIEGLTIDQLAALFCTHRATTARWVAGARRKLVELTRSELRRQLQCSEGEAESIAKLLRSRLDVSLRRLLEA